MRPEFMSKVEEHVGTSHEVGAAVTRPRLAAPSFVGNSRRTEASLSGCTPPGVRWQCLKCLSLRCTWQQSRWFSFWQVQAG